MSDIKYPLRVGRDDGNPFVHIRDASNRIIAANLIGRDAAEIVAGLNEHAAFFDPDSLTGCADDGDELSSALSKITPERLNELLAEMKGQNQ